jgi:hypothetical protein
LSYDGAYLKNKSMKKIAVLLLIFIDACSNVPFSCDQCTPDTVVKVIYKDTFGIIVGQENTINGANNEILFEGYISKKTDSLLMDIINKRNEKTSKFNR